MNWVAVEEQKLSYHKKCIEGLVLKVPDIGHVVHTLRLQIAQFRSYLKTLGPNVGSKP